MLSANKIKEYAKLSQKKYRDIFGLFLVEGKHLVDEALKTDLVVEVLTSDLSLCQGTYVDQKIIDKIATTTTPQKVIAICKKKEVKEPGNKVVALDNISDPGNTGTIIRNALAFNWNTVIVQGVDIYSPKVVRSSQGAIFHIDVIQTEDLKQYFKNYFVIGAVVSKDAKEYSQVNIGDKTMLILGNEGAGISKENLPLLNEQVYIKVNFESLNVASASAILLHAYQTK